MNIFTGIGRMTRDPELRYSTSGTAVCSFTIAIDRQFNREETDFINVKCFKAQAENVAKYCKKGSKVAISGSLQSGSYEKDGRKIYTWDVIANQVQFLDTKGGQVNARASDDNPFAGSGQPINIPDDSLPF